MDETPYQFGYRQAYTSNEKVIPYDHTIFEKRLDKIAYTNGWDNGHDDRLKKEKSDDVHEGTSPDVPHERLDADLQREGVLSHG